MGGGKKNLVKFVSLILATSLALSCTFFSCANASGGGSDNPGGNANPTTGENAPQSLSSARWSCTTSEEETAIGNKVSEVLCLFDDNKFELRKNISYEDISFYQTFYKGTYEGSVIKGMMFAIKEELDTADFDDEMNQVFNLENADAKTARSAMPNARAVSLSDIASILDACRAKLKDAKFKTVTDKSMSLEKKTEDNSVVLIDVDGNENDVVENAVDGCINLDGFLLTGNPCNMIPENEKDFRWANTEDEGARALEKTKDGKWTCQFRADSDDTLIRIIWNNWMADWGLSAIDKENSTLPSGAGITDDTQAVNNTSENKKWQDPRNIAITGLEAKRKYDITFDTKKSPGKICIELAEHKISTLDGWLLSGTPVEMEVSKYEHGGKWPINTEDGALPLKKTGSNSWTITVTTKQGWNGFRIIRENWIDEIGWSSFDWKDRYEIYGELCGASVFDYALKDEDSIAFQKWDFDGTEKVTLTFGISNGRITCKTDIQYTKEFQVDGLYFAWVEAEKPVLIKNKKVNFTAINDLLDSDECFTEIHLLEKINGNPPAGGSLEGSYYYYDEGACWYDGESYYFFKDFSRFNFENTKLPSGVSVDAGEYYMIIMGLTTGKQYTLTFDTTSTMGKFSLNIE